MSEKTFLLGVGCQKGGTTWLHQYLDSHPQCDLGFQKEYHVFDAMYLDESAIHRNRVDSLAALLRSREALEKDSADARKLDRKIRRKQQLVSFCEDPDSYAEYFDRLYRQNAQTKLVGDITPAYSALRGEHFTSIKSLLESRGFTVRVVFLMRDPIERIYSAIYMEIARTKRRSKKIDQGPEQLFLARYDNEKVEMKTRYENTLAALDQSFEARHTFLGFYETLFSEAGVGEVISFLGIDYVKPNLKKRVHAAKQKTELSTQSISEVRKYYDDTYRYCGERFGQDFINSIWKHAQPGKPARGWLGKIRGLVGG